MKTTVGVFFRVIRLYQYMASAIRYRVLGNGVIYDRKTALEWYVGPDENTNREQAKSWIASLSVGGGGWRMPTPKELRGLYKKKGPSPLFQNNGLKWIWVFGTNGVVPKNFSMAGTPMLYRHATPSGRIFAVRHGL